MRLRLLFVTALAVLVVVPAAQAKGGLVFDRSTARVGDSLSLSASWESPRSGIVVSLLPLAVSPKWWPTYQAYAPSPGKPPTVKGAVRLGRTLRWGAHGTRLVFHVPRVAPGRYVLGFWCVACNTHWTSALPNYQPLPRGILRITD